MLSDLAKILILRTVPMFAQTSDAVLASIADLLREQDVPAGQTIIRKGDVGDCMFIIVEGVVRVHDGEHTLNYLSRRDVFGELAVLDAEARSVSVTAVAPTRLLLLEQAALYGLMNSHIEVAHGLFHVLCARLRGEVRESTEEFRYLQQFARVTAAAAAVEAGIFEVASLDDIAQRSDALGQLARIFQRMARQVYVREQQLEQQVQELRIEVNQAQSRDQVRDITESEFFVELQHKAQSLRQHHQDDDNHETPTSSERQLFQGGGTMGSRLN
jgi:CRP-like cAMP-binding protein